MVGFFITNDSNDSHDDGGKRETPHMDDPIDKKVEFV